jgi:polysaccharide biosynthesis protein PslE
MKEQIILMSEEKRLSGYTARDLAATIFRHRRLAVVSIIAVFAGGLLAAFYLPKYNSEFEVLVQRGRVDPVVTAEQDARPELTHDITEEELNSEAAMMQSPDILRQVVIVTGLDKREHGLFVRLTPEEKIQKAVARLPHHLDAAVIKKTNIVQTVYSDKDPQMAERVAKTLAALYLEKHAQVHRPNGQTGFFEKQVSEAQVQLKDWEDRLAAFNKAKATVTPGAERDLAVQKMGDFMFIGQQAKASAAETQDRIRALEQLETSVPNRITTTVKVADNPMLMEQMKSKLLDLELQRSTLLAKYQPTYRPIIDVEKQIAETKAAIDAEQANPVKEKSTDLNATNVWVRSALAQAHADLATYQAGDAAAKGIVNRYQAMTQELASKALEEHDIQRNLKVSEDNYLLYQQKMEEARISDALDKQRILNVSLAELPSASVLPAHPVWLYGLLGALLACVLSGFAVFTAEVTDNTFRTTNELRAYLQVPVLATLHHPSAASIVERHQGELLSYNP